jgi:FG-GAP-like repeat
VMILLGNKDGTFATPTSVAVGTNPVGVVVADFDGDGEVDFAVANGAAGPNNISVVTGKGDGTFAPPQHLSASSTPTGIAAGDLNGDGRADVVVPNANGNLTVWLRSAVPGCL